MTGGKAQMIRPFHTTVQGRTLAGGINITMTTQTPAKTVGEAAWMRIRLQWIRAMRLSKAFSIMAPCLSARSILVFGLIQGRRLGVLTFTTLITPLEQIGEDT